MLRICNIICTCDDWSLSPSWNNCTNI